MYPFSTDMAELTFKAVFLGVIMAVVLGAANAYLGMKAGLNGRGDLPSRRRSNGGAQAIPRHDSRREHRAHHGFGG